MTSRLRGSAGLAALCLDFPDIRAYDKGINSRACGWGARGASQGCRDLGQKLQDCDIAGPEGWQERAGVGTRKKGGLHRAVVLHEAASPRDLLRGVGGVGVGGWQIQE